MARAANALSAGVPPERRGDRDHSGLARQARPAADAVAGEASTRLVLWGNRARSVVPPGQLLLKVDSDPCFDWVSEPDPLSPESSYASFLRASMREGGAGATRKTGTGIGRVRDRLTISSSASADAA